MPSYSTDGGGFCRDLICNGKIRGKRYYLGLSYLNSDEYMPILSERAQSREGVLSDLPHGPQYRRGLQ